MRFTTKGLFTGVIASLFIMLLLYTLLRSFGLVGRTEAVADPLALAREAADNLEKVRQRQPGERRPASYDSVMTPLDKLLNQAKTLLESESYDPVRDFEKVRGLTLPVIDIATAAAHQAASETGPLAKEYRFNDQKGEACQYLANAMWERINIRYPRQAGNLSEPAPYPVGEMTELKRVLDTGIEATRDNRSLYYIRGVLNRAEGLWLAASRDLSRAVAIDPDFAAAWNVLGLVRINLKEFDLAEEALENAKKAAAREAAALNQEPGDEYTAILYNLAMLHDRLAAYYGQENRITPTVESQRMLAKHADFARRYFQEFIAREPSDSPDAREARRRLDALSQ